MPKVMLGDDPCLEGILLSPESFSTAGPEDACECLERSAHPNVLDASATSPQKGIELVTVLSREGNGTPDGHHRAWLQTATQSGQFPYRGHTNLCSPGAINSA